MFPIIEIQLFRFGERKIKSFFYISSIIYKRFFVKFIYLKQIYRRKDLGSCVVSCDIRTIRVP